MIEIEKCLDAPGSLNFGTRTQFNDNLIFFYSTSPVHQKKIQNNC